MNSILDLLSQKEVEQGLRRLLSPAWLFWLVGAALSVLVSGPQVWVFLQRLASSLDAQGWALFVGVPLFVLVLLSEWFIGLFEEGLLRGLEGYEWPRLFHGVRERLRARQHRARAALEQELEALAAQVREGLRGQALDPRLVERYAALDRARYAMPQGYVLPTRLGNLLRAAEEYAESRYGLNAVLVWPRLWLLLPAETRELLARAYRDLVAAVRGWGWGLAFGLVWVPVTGYLAVCSRGWVWVLLTGLVSLGWMRLAYRLAVSRAAVFGELVRAAFDLHRLALYDALGWPRPKPEEEVATGRRLTAFLWRGERNHG